MKFARPSHELSRASRFSRQRPRPSRACRPALGLERFEDRTLLSTSLVSVNAAGISSGNSDSDFTGSTFSSFESFSLLNQSTQANVSADGTRFAFVSDATDLVSSPSDTNQSSDVFVRDMTTGQTSLVSVTPQGASGNDNSFDPVISPDGRYVAFVSLATNLSDVAAKTPGPLEIQAPGNLYVRDLQTQTTTLLDQTPGGQASDGWSRGQFVFSPDSKTLAWIDTSDNLTTATVDPSSGSNPNQANLPPGYAQPPTYVYVRDLARQTTSLVSVSTNGQAAGDTSQANASPAALVFSPDSQSLVFGSSATDLTTNPADNSPNPGSGDILFLATSTNLFLRDLAAGTTTLLSVTTDGQLGAGYSVGAVFSPDGHSVAFSSNAHNLAANAVDPAPPPGTQSGFPAALESNIFIRNLTSGTTSIVSVTPDGLASNGMAGEAIFSPEGSSIAFVSNATDLTSNPVDSTPAPGNASPGSLGPDFNGNVFLRDLTAGTTTLVSVTPDGKLSNGSANQILFSPGGRSLAFISSAGDLTHNAFEATPPTIPGVPSYPGFNNPSPIGNVFVRDLAAQTTTLASATTGGQLSNASAYGLIFSPDSGSLIFRSSAINLTSNPPDVPAVPPWPGYIPSFDGINLFVHDLAAGTTSLISATSDGKLSNSNASAVLSPDGNTIYFDGSADNLTANDSNQMTDIFAATAPFSASNQFQFQSWQSSASESDGQTVITVRRSGPATAAASVDYAVQDGTAHAGTDFTATSGTLDFAAGETAKTFSVPLVPGDQFAGTLSANLVLSNSQGATLGYPTAVLNLTGVAASSNPTPCMPPTTNPNPTTNPTINPSSTSNSSPTTTPVTPVHVVTPQPGPTVVSVASMKGRQGVKSLVITFDKALDPVSAIKRANFQVSLPGHARFVRHGHLTAARPARSLAISKAVYDPAKHQVTLTLHTRLHQREAIEIQIKGTAGGLADAQGTALNSPDKLKLGKDYITALEVLARHS